MLYGILSTIFVILCFFMILIILLQKSKGSLGIMGSAGSGAQMLFGGTGGQDLFQKITWTCVACFMIGSFVLAILKNTSVNESKYLQGNTAPIEAIAPATIPVSQPEPITIPQEEQPSPETPQQIQTVATEA